MSNQLGSKFLVKLDFIFQIFTVFVAMNEEKRLFLANK